MSAAMKLDAERELFVREMLRLKYFEAHDFERDEYGYMDDLTNAAWLAWQARAALPTTGGEEVASAIEAAEYTPPNGYVYAYIAGHREGFRMAKSNFAELVRATHRPEPAQPDSGEVIIIGGHSAPWGGF
jgi:hypothetical protein